MSIFSKTRIPVAQVNRSTQRFRTNHITTADFMQLNVVYKRELVPNQSIEVDVSTFCRTESLPVPTFGDCTIKHHAFFVPYRTIMPSWNDFYNDTPHQTANSTSSGLVPFSHRLHLSLLSLTFWTNPIMCHEITQGTQSEQHDACVWTGVPATATQHYYRFTSLGRQFYKVLRSLGYVLTPYCTSDVLSDSKLYVSALPLLSLVRVYLDYYWPSAYVGDADYNSLYALVNKSPSTGYTLSQSDFGYIFLYLSNVCYDSDYFTSAFDNPAGPNQGLFSSVSLIDSSTLASDASSLIVSQSNGTPVVNTDSGQSTNVPRNLSQFALDSLKKLSDYMKRNQLTGSRALERYLARFGVVLSNEKLNRSIMLGSYDLPLHFGAVMSNADTTGARLGAYAGQGFAADPSGNGKFKFDNGDEFGMFFILTSIVPKVGYVQGIDRNLFHLSKLDYFTPEFDALGTQAISKAELCVNQFNLGESVTPSDDGGDISSTIDGVFGFTPRYAEYKIAHNQLTGDYLIPHLNGTNGQDTSPSQDSLNPLASNSWHLNRLFSTATVHSRDFLFPLRISGANSYNGADQYDRIFYNPFGTADHFGLIYNFDVVTSFPGKPLFDTYDFEDTSKKIVEIETGGTKVN